MDKSVEETITNFLTKEQLERMTELAKYLNTEKSYDFSLGFVFGINWLIDCVINENKP